MTLAFLATCRCVFGTRLGSTPGAVAALAKVDCLCRLFSVVVVKRSNGFLRFGFEPARAAYQEFVGIHISNASPYLPVRANLVARC
jgi:hypothetical protein